jgi:hypothetical protein
MKCSADGGPSRRRASAEVISAILTTEPPPISLSGLAPVGGGEDGLIRKCLQKDAGRCYQAMGDLISDLEQIRREYESGQVRPATTPIFEASSVYRGIRILLELQRNGSSKL